MQHVASNSGRRWRRIAGLGLAAVAVVAAAGGFALLRTPAWYAPPVIAMEDRQRVRNSLVDAEQAFTESLRAGQPFVYTIRAEDVNRWIAMRREIYPLLEELTPPELHEPFVVFDEGEITVAGGYRLGGLRVIVSVDVRVGFRDGAIEMIAAGARCGSAKAPLDFGRLGMDRSVAFDDGRLWPGSPRMWGDFVSGFHVAAEGWWKNGGIAYRVTDVAVVPGQINLAVTPLGRQPPRKRSE